MRLGSAGVAPEVNIREHVTHTPLPSANKALKPRGDITRSPKQGYKWPLKRTHVLQNLKISIANKCEERRNVLISFPKEASPVVKPRAGTHCPSLYMVVIDFYIID